jgi:non-ribosomal peptide synthetase component F
MTLLAAWAALLTRLSGQHEVVIGSPTANRTRTEIEPLIGFFVNTLALRIDVSGAPTTSELLARVKVQTLSAQEHQDIPFEHVVKAVHAPRSLAHAPVFQVMFALQNAPQSDFELPGLRVSPIIPPHVTAMFDLSLSLEENGEQIVGGLEYATALFDRKTIERYLGYWRNLLEAMAGAGNCRDHHWTAADDFGGRTRCTCAQRKGRARCAPANFRLKVRSGSR